MASDDHLCTLEYQGKTLAFGGRDLTVSKLEQFEAWWGPLYGNYSDCMRMFLAGNAKAVRGVLWLLLKREGAERPVDTIDFAPYDIMKAINTAAEEKAKELEAAGEEATNSPLEVAAGLDPESGETQMTVSRGLPTDSDSSTSDS